jgi:hypothetical protein
LKFNTVVEIAIYCVAAVMLPGRGVVIRWLE